MRDFSKVPEYSKRQMFLDPAGPVTVQRFDDYAYPKIAKFDEAQRGSFWIPEEITLTKDKIDYAEASESTRHIFTSNILRQTTLDSEQGRAPFTIFDPVVSIPEMENLVTTWTWFEQIHSRAYSHIIRNIYAVSVTEFNRIHQNKEILGMVSSIDKYYNELHDLNCRIATREDYLAKGGKASDDFAKALEVSEHEHIKAIWMALIASYGLEAIRFTVSFATSLGMKENKIFMGNGSEIELILADEMLHVDWTAYIINTVVKDDPRFAEVANELRHEAHAALVDVGDEEKSWSHYLFSKGPNIGLNEKLMNGHIDETMDERFRRIGMRYGVSPKTVSFPWFKKYLNTNKKQTALQETESIAYIIGSMGGDLNLDELPNI